jgi:Protein involved in formate dehydrogenase formation
MAAAASRWAAILADRPELAPAVALQQQLIALVVDLTETVEHARLPRLSLPPRYLAAKLTRGIPAFATEPIPLPVPAMAPALLSLCDELARGGAGETAEHIRSAIAESRMDAGSLLTASFTRDQDAIRTGATHRSLSPDLVWLVAELAVSPYAHVLQRVLLTPADPTLAAALANWGHGYCPACGSWPALAEIHESHRVLRCSFCAHAWELKTFSRVLRRERRPVRHVRRQRQSSRPARRNLRRLRRLSQDGRCRRAFTLSSPRHRRSGDDGARHAGNGEGVPAAASQRFQETLVTEGLRPSDSPTRSLARRCAGALRSRGSLARSLATQLVREMLSKRRSPPGACPTPARRPCAGCSRARPSSRSPETR